MNEKNKRTTWYIKTQLRRSVTKEDTSSTSKMVLGDTITKQTDEIKMTHGDKAVDAEKKMTLVNLSVEQTKGLNYPINCPVWYNFSSQSSGTVHEGIVRAVSLDIISKRLVFKVQRKHDESVHTVLENDIGYATNCPISLSSSTATNASSETPMDGEVMFAKPIKDCENGNSEMTYIIKLLPAGGEKHVIKIEEGVKASRLKYREVGEEISKQDDTTKEGVNSSTEGGSSNGTIPHPTSLAVSEEEKSFDEQSQDKPPSENANVQDGEVTRGDRINITKKLVKKQCKRGGSNMRMPKVKVKAECMYQPNNRRNKRNYHSAAGPPRNTIVQRGDTRDYSYYGRTPRNDHPIRNNEGGRYSKRYEDTGRGTTRDYKRQASHGSVSIPSQASKRTKIEESNKSEDDSQSMCCEPPHASYENDGAI